MMSEFFADVEFWHWWVLAVVFVVLEVFSPAAFFLWLGIAAAAMGLLVMLMPDMAWEMQIVLFAVLSVVSTVAGRRYFVRHLQSSDHPKLNRRGEHYVDRVFTLDEPIVNGVGKIRVDDTTWKVSGADCPAGTRVRVTGVNGVVLEVVCEQ